MNPRVLRSSFVAALLLLGSVRGLVAESSLGARDYCQLGYRALQLRLFAEASYWFDWAAVVDARPGGLACVSYGDNEVFYAPQYYLGLAYFQLGDSTRSEKWWSELEEVRLGTTREADRAAIETMIQLSRELKSVGARLEQVQTSCSRFAGEANRKATRDCALRFRALRSGLWKNWPPESPSSKSSLEKLRLRASELLDWADRQEARVSGPGSGAPPILRGGLAASSHNGRRGLRLASFERDEPTEDPPAGVLSMDEPSVRQFVAQENKFALVVAPGVPGISRVDTAGLKKLSATLTSLRFNVQGIGLDNTPIEKDKLLDGIGDFLGADSPPGTRLLLMILAGHGCRVPRRSGDGFVSFILAGKSKTCADMKTSIGHDIAVLDIAKRVQLLYAPGDRVVFMVDSCFADIDAEFALRYDIHPESDEVFRAGTIVGLSSGSPEQTAAPTVASRALDYVLAGCGRLRGQTVLGALALREVQSILQSDCGYGPSLGRMTLPIGREGLKGDFVLQIPARPSNCVSPCPRR